MSYEIRPATGDEEIPQRMKITSHHFAEPL